MVRVITIIALLASLAGLATAQTPLVAKPDEQARIKPLVAAETKARDALLAKMAALPEQKAVNDAKAAYDKALAALNDANKALDDAAKALPEYNTWKEAGARSLDTAYRILADHQLSSREYRPQVNDKGDLIFVKANPAQ